MNADRTLRPIVAALTLLLSLALWATLPAAASAAPCSATQSVSKGLGEKTTKQLPAGRLYWRLESFASKAAAEGAAGPYAVPFETGGKFWLGTIATKGETTPGGTLVAEMGPLPMPTATEYRLRVQERVSQPGCEGDMHTHPGAEAWYMLAGEQTVITLQGETTITAGQTLVAPPPGQPMQLAYRGTEISDALTFLALDASQPNSSPTTFTPGLPNTGSGGMTSAGRAQALAPALALAAACAVALVLRRRAAHTR